MMQLNAATTRFNDDTLKARGGKGGAEPLAATRPAAMSNMMEGLLEKRRYMYDDF